MATTYAALVSLMNVLTRYQNPTCPVTFNQSQIQSMLNKVNSLVDFLEAYSQRMSEDLIRRMTDAAYAAEDIIESYYVDQLLATSAGNSKYSFWRLKRSQRTRHDHLCQDLEKALEGMDLIVHEAMEQYGNESDQQPESSVRVGQVVNPSGKTKMVGLDEELVHLMDQLTSDKSTLQILPIVGMGGIGKTTLARNLFEHPYVEHHFHIQAWVTISQNYSIDEVIHSLLSAFGASGTDGEHLYRHLCGRKYLIVLDDIWDDLAWNEIRKLFPDNRNGSRILLTTRISNVANSIGSCIPHAVKLLDDNKSWDLLSETVSGQEIWLPEFIKCGKEIAKSCKGLPLTIVVVGGLLKTRKSIKYWEYVASNVKSFINIGNDGHCLKILSLSYDYLPIHLKPCFLYMATFKEDEKAGVSDLIKLWVADGFLKPQNNRTLEEVALEYLNHLIDRNLIMVAEQGPTGGIIDCSLHDLLRELCIREVQKEQFIYQLKVNKNVLDSPSLESTRRLICYLPQEIPKLPMSVVRSLTCIGASKSDEFSFDNTLGNKKIPFFDVLSFTCRLLRIMRTNWVDLKVDIRHLVNLRYLRCKVMDKTNGDPRISSSLFLCWNSKTSDVPRFYSSLHLFWNLETLDILTWGETIILPSEFWELSNLRHVLVNDFCLPEPKNSQRNCVLNNLQTLRYSNKNFNVSVVVVKKIPQLKALELRYDEDFCRKNLGEISGYFTNLALLHKLQELKCCFSRDLKYDLCVFEELKNLTFSRSLRELKLDGSNIPWEYMTIIGSLPKLDTLELSNNAFCGDEWNSTEGDFEGLKHLSIKYCDLRIWGAESSHFPMLVHLELDALDLEEIPSGIGEVASLQSIYLDTNQMSVVISAKVILEERHGQGDDGFVIQGLYKGLPDEERDLEDMATINFRVKFVQDHHRTM